MRLVYFGSGEFGLPTLAMLCDAHDVAAVVTRPDRPAGRKRKLTPTPVAQFAQQRGLPAIKAEDANAEDVVAQVRELGATTTRDTTGGGIVIAFGQKLSPQLIDAAGALVVNLHGSLLPKYRGAAPVNWAIINGERETGLSVIGLAQRMDAGLIYGQATTAIDPMETAGELHDRLAAMGPQLFARVLAEYEAGTLRGEPQDDAAATRAPKLNKTDGTVDFDDSPDAVRCRIHGLTPWPGATVMWVHDGAEQTLLLRRVRSQVDACDEAPGTVLPANRIAARGGTIELLEVQPPGKRVMSIKDFTRGHALRPGDVLRPV